MKKLFSISMMLFLILSGMLIINLKVNDYFNNLLYNNQKEVSLQLNSTANYSKLIATLEKTSVGKTGVSQYFFTGNNQLIIYSANSDLPSKTSKTLKNKPLTNYTGNKSLIIPNNNYSVKLYPLIKIKNLGLNSVFYVHGDVNRIVSVMKKFGRVTLRPSSNINSPRMTSSITLFTVSVFMYILLFISMMLVRISESKAITLYTIQGYGIFENCFQSLRALISPTVFAIFSSLIFLAGFAVQETVLPYFKLYTFEIIMLNILVVLSAMFVYAISVAAQIVFFKTISNWQHGSGFAIFVSAVAFAFCVISTGIAIPKFHQNFLHYQEQTSQFKIWANTKNIYQTNVTNQLDRENKHEELKFDLSSKRLWENLEAKGSTFVVFSNNFLGISDDKGHIRPWYAANPDNKNIIDLITSPTGKSLTADTNYLRISKTQLVNKQRISDLKPTLYSKILIVPLKYKKYENKIRSRYLSESLFQLNEDLSSWKRLQKIPMYNKKNLKIKIVYARNNQKYFTYNSDTLSDAGTSIVVDPIINVFDRYQYSFLYGNLFTLNGGFFLIDHHTGKTYNRIQPALKSSGMGNMVNYVTSVYAKKSEAIQIIKNSTIIIFSQMILLVIMSMISITVLINQYVLSKEKALIIKQVLGYRLYQTMRWPIAFIIIVFVFSSLLGTFVLGTFDLFQCGFLIALLIWTLCCALLASGYQLRRINRIVGRS